MNVNAALVNKKSVNAALVNKDYYKAWQFFCLAETVKKIATKRISYKMW